MPRTTSLIEDAILGVPIRDTPKLVPGLVLVSGIITFAIFICNSVNQYIGHVGLISYILVGIVTGIIIKNVVGVPEIFGEGIRFCIRKLLKLGIILLGIKLSLSHVVIVGVWGVPIILGCMLIGLITTIYLTRMFDLSTRLGVLIAIGTSICGASAIVATAPTIRATDEEVAYAVANITIFGLLAMFIYPYLAHWLFGGNILQIGLFMGTAIHETAQVAGAGLIYDQTFNIASNPSVSDVAVVTKLVRNLMMALVIPVMAIVYSRRLDPQKESFTISPSKIVGLFPVFILGFLGLVILRTFADVYFDSEGVATGSFINSGWVICRDLVATLSGYIIGTAMVGVGLGTSLTVIRRIGFKPFGIGFFASTIVAITSITLTYAFGPLVNF